MVVLPPSSLLPLVLGAWGGRTGGDGGESMGVVRLPIAAPALGLGARKVWADGSGAVRRHMDPQRGEGGGGGGGGEERGGGERRRGGEEEREGEKSRREEEYLKQDIFPSFLRVFV